MTPKEKAKELVSKYNSITNYDKYQSKKAALIAVDEILSIKNLEYEDYIYYQEVKKQIK